MDSGGIFCLHYPFCSSPAMGAGMVYAPDVHPAGPTGVRGKRTDAASPLGAFGGDSPFVADSSDGIGGRPVPGTSRI